MSKLYGLEDLTKDIMSEKSLVCVALPRPAFQLCRDQLIAMQPERDRKWFANDQSIFHHASFQYMGVKVRLLVKEN